MARFRTAFITGASSGIGRSVAERLAAKGTRVILAARREQELESVRNALVSGGAQADIQKLDVADTEAVGEAVARWERDTGGLDLVLANAGFGGAHPAARLEWAQAERMLQVNVLGAFATLIAAIPGMVSRGHGTL